MKESLKPDVIEVSKTENVGEIVPSTKEQLLNKGEERYENTAKFISNAGDKVSGWIKNGASKFGRFFKGAAIRAFAAPDAIAHGTKVVGEKIGEEVELAKEGAQFVGGKIVEGIKSVGDDLAKLDEFTSGKVEQAGEWIEGKVISSYEFTSDKTKQAKEYIKIKGEQIAVYSKDKYELAQAVGSLVKEKTSEKLNEVGDKLSNNYERVTKFGKGAVETATLKAWYARDAFNAKMNSIKKNILERKAEIQNEKLQKTLGKLKQLEMVGNLETSMAA